MELRLATKDDLDTGLAAFRNWFYRAQFVQTLCISGMLALALVVLR